MKRRNLLLTVIIALLTVSVMAQTSKMFHDFKVQTVDGEDFDFSQLKGKKVLIVNTASKCGYTPQYKDLEELFQQFKKVNFVVIAFPANNFGKQEPGTNKEIRQFCTEKYSVSFPVMSKISVKGDDMHPLYKWLTSKNENGRINSEVSWNFQKYLINEKGELVDVLEPKVNPLSEKITEWLKGE